MPTSTDLVTDLPADFEVFGQAVATSMADLLGGTTGQVLAKTTSTDMDFTWTTPQVGDITGVTAGVGITGGGTSGTVTVTNDMATTITTNGDLLYGTGSGTYTRRAIGSTGNVLTVAGGIPTWAAPAASASGLTLVLAQTIGNGVSSVTVTNAFNTTYDDYLVIVSGGTAASSASLQLKLGATTTGYYETQIYGTYTSVTVSNFSQSNVGSYTFGRTSTAALNGYGLVGSPFLAKRTVLWSTSTATVTGDSSGTSAGMLDNATSYTDLVISSSASMTGGTIRVYGYQKS